MQQAVKITAIAFELFCFRGLGGIDRLVIREELSRRFLDDAIRFAARTEAMITDPVYEGKSMQGMIDLVKKGFFPDGAKVLYAHLGGAPALNGYSYTYRNG